MAQPLLTMFQAKALPGGPQRVRNALYFIKGDASDVVTLFVTDSIATAWPVIGVGSTEEALAGSYDGGAASAASVLSIDGGAAASIHTASIDGGSAT